MEPILAATVSKETIVKKTMPFIQGLRDTAAESFHATAYKVSTTREIEFSRYPSPVRAATIKIATKKKNMPHPAADHAAPSVLFVVF